MISQWVTFIYLKASRILGFSYPGLSSKGIVCNNNDIIVRQEPLQSAGLVLSGSYFLAYLDTRSQSQSSLSLFLRSLSSSEHIYFTIHRISFTTSRIECGSALNCLNNVFQKSKWINKINYNKYNSCIMHKFEYILGVKKKWK